MKAIRQRAARWFGCLVFCGTLAACHQVLTQPDTKNAGTVEISNWTEVDLWVAFDGQVLGTVAAGQRARYRWLAPGPLHAVAKSASTAEIAEHAFSRRLEVPSTGLVTWDVKVPGSDAPEPPKLSELVVENTLLRAMTVNLDGRHLGPVLPGDTRRFRDLRSGDRQLHASDKAAAVVLEESLDLPADGEARWVLAAAKGLLTITNDTDEAVRFRLDGQRLSTLAAGDSQTWDDHPSGPHDVRGVGEVTGRTYHRAVDLRADFPVTWRLSGELASVVVDNQSGEILEAGVESRDMRRIAPGGEERIGTLKPGLQRLRARGADSGRSYTTEAHLRSGQVFRWQVFPTRRSVRVENRTTSALALYLDGVERFVLDPGAVKVLRDVTRSTARLLAVAIDRRHVFETQVAFGQTDAFQWVIRAKKGDVLLSNRRPEAMRIYVDARHYADVRPDSKLRLTGIDVGDHLVEAVGDVSGVRLARRAHVTPEKAARVVLDDPRGFVEVRNDTGEVLFAQGALAAQRRDLQPGQTLRYSLLPGHHALHFLGDQSGMSYSQNTEVLQGRAVRWGVVRATGTLLVDNQLSEAVRIAVDGVERGVVPAEGHLALVGIGAGTHRFRAEGEATHQLVNYFREMPPNGRLNWTLRNEPTILVVDNGTPEAVEIRIDDRPYGRVEAGSVQRFGELPVGRRRVSAVGLPSGVSYHFDLVLQHGRREVLKLAPPHAHLVVVNRSGEDLTVRMDSQVIGSVTSDAGTVKISAPAGKRVLRVERRRSGSFEVYDLDLRPEEAYYIPVGTAHARLVVVNRCASPRGIYVGDRFVGTVDAGGEVIVDSLTGGEVTLQARRDDASTTHREIRKLWAGETGTWVLLPREEGD